MRPIYFAYKTLSRAICAAVEGGLGANSSTSFSTLFDLSCGAWGVVDIIAIIPYFKRLI